MQLEILPNELLLNLFEFFDSIDLLRSFSGLNLRFNQLLSTHIRTHQLNLQSISKDDFDLLCHQYLPLLITQITSLRLSNEETPDLIHLLFSRGFVLDRCIRLQSLTLHCIYSLDTLIEITLQCRHLPCLTHLNIIECHIDMRKSELFDLFNNIWSIPTLTHSNLNGIRFQPVSLSKITAVSSSMTDLSIEKIPLDLDRLSHLFKSTPHLQRLSAKVICQSTDETLRCVMPSLTLLEIFFQCSIDSMKNIFSVMSNLLHLTVETVDMHLDGHVWEQIITNCFPRLQLFRLKMKLEYPGHDNCLEKQIDQLLATFRTSFWLEEHQWYVRCDWELSERATPVTLYTLPFAFNTIQYLQEVRTKSTCVDDSKYRSYKQVEMFENNQSKSLDLCNFNLVCAQFPNLRCLDISLPLSDGHQLDHVILNQLTSLIARIQIATAYSQLQTICDRAPRLYSLRIFFWQKFTDDLNRLTSSSIRRLYLGGMFDHWNNEFTKEECVAFSESFLGRQCEVLSIEVEDRISIIDLIQRMSNLRLLNVRCMDDKWDYRKLPSTKYELVYWIQNRFSSMSTVVRNPEKSSYIQVWIDQQGKHSKRAIFLSQPGHKISQLFSSVQKFFSKK